MPKESSSRKVSARTTPYALRASDSRTIALVTYDGKLTGSMDTRNDNAYRVFPLLTALQQAGNLTMIGQYAFDYDSPPPGANKKLEPFFDAFLVGIANLNDATFNANFKYITTSIDEDVPLSPLQNPIQWQDSKLRTNVVINDGQTVDKTREELFTNSSYRDAKHIYIMGPASQSCYDGIVAQLTRNPRSNFIIHVQGEANSRDEASKTINYSAPGMTPKAGMFPVSFNYWTGENEMYKIRALTTNQYTVGLREEAPRHIANYVAPNGAPANVNMPRVYVDMLDYVLYRICSRGAMPVGAADGPLPYETMTSPLNNVLVCQDMFDKDNSASIALAISTTSVRSDIIIIGRRVYDRCAQQQLFAVVPPHQPVVARIQQGQTIGGQAPPLGHMRCCGNQEWQCPVSIIPGQPLNPDPTLQISPNIGLNLDRTTQALITSQRAIQAMINNLNPALMARCNIKPVAPEDITDGIGAVSLSGRAPFPESMFTYVNYWDGVLGAPVFPLIGNNCGSPVDIGGAAAMAVGGRRRYSNKNRKRNRKSKKRRNRF
uniref:Uncharacterized protein n=1 Tax=viral metagenome TaxID=1070528 RepID=A0A6C0BAD3_9ZZZZ